MDGDNYIADAVTEVAISDVDKRMFVNELVQNLVAVSDQKTAAAILFPLCALGARGHGVRNVLQSSLFHVASSILSHGFPADDVYKMIKNEDKVIFSSNIDNIGLIISRFNTAMNLQDIPSTIFKVKLFDSLTYDVFAPSGVLAKAIVAIISTPSVPHARDDTLARYQEDLSDNVKTYLRTEKNVRFKNIEGKTQFDCVIAALQKTELVQIYGPEFVKGMIYVAMSDYIEPLDLEPDVLESINVAHIASSMVVNSVLPVFFLDNALRTRATLFNAAAASGFTLAVPSKDCQKTLSDNAKICMDHRNIRKLDYLKDEQHKPLCRYQPYFQAVHETIPTALIYGKDKMKSNFFPGHQRTSVVPAGQTYFYSCPLTRISENVKVGPSKRVKSWVADTDENRSGSLAQLRYLVSVLNHPQIIAFSVRIVFGVSIDFFSALENVLEVCKNKRFFPHLVTPTFPHEPAVWLCGVSLTLPPRLLAYCMGFADNEKIYADPDYASTCRKRGIDAFIEIGERKIPNFVGLADSLNRGKVLASHFYDLENHRREIGMCYRQLEYNQNFLTPAYIAQLLQLNTTLASARNKHLFSTLQIFEKLSTCERYTKLQYITEKELFKNTTLGRRHGNKIDIQSRKGAAEGSSTGMRMIMPQPKKRKPDDEKGKEKEIESVDIPSNDTDSVSAVQADIIPKVKVLFI
jgi:hypothetical protein